MPWLRHLAVLFAFLAAFVRPAPASAFTPASPEARVGGFEVAAQLLASDLAAASREHHQGIGAAYDENASDYRFAARSIAPSSKALGRALEAAGHVRPPGSAAHHIVAGGAQKAAEARAVLDKFGIGINDAANGAFLPSGVHARIHTNAYYETVNSALRQATTREEALQALDAIRRGLP